MRIDNLTIIAQKTRLRNKTERTPVFVDMRDFIARHSSYPSEIRIEQDVYRYFRVLKTDFFSINVLYRSKRGDGYVLKLSDFRMLFGLLLRPLACLMSRHEYRVYQRLEDINGIPALGPRWGWRGYLHRYIEGQTLHEITPDGSLPDQFFDELTRILSAVHARNVWYVDMNKRGNILCSIDGHPHLIDFQISVAFPMNGDWLARLWMPLFRRLIREDLFHLYKHKRAFQPERMTAEELTLATRSTLNRWYARFLGRPYLRVKRLVYPHGSNETI